MADSDIHEVCVRIQLSEPPTLEDRATRKGFPDLLEELKRVGWVDDSGVSTKFFKFSYKGHIEEGNHYLEWKATLSH